MRLFEATEYKWIPVVSVPSNAKEVQVCDGLLYLWILSIHEGTYYVVRKEKATGEIRNAHQVDMSKRETYWDYSYED